MKKRRNVFLVASVGSREIKVIVEIVDERSDVHVQGRRFGQSIPGLVVVGFVGVIVWALFDMDMVEVEMHCVILEN